MPQPHPSGVLARPRLRASEPWPPSLALAVSLTLILATAGPALAQTATDPAASARGSVARFDVSLQAQPLAQALNELARQAGIQVIFPPALVAGKSAPAVSGRMTAQQALDRLLAGSGLAAAVDAQGSAVVRQAPQPAPAPRASLPPAEAPDAQLSEVVVTGSKRGDTVDESPASVRVLRPNDLANSASTDAYDLLLKVPGVVTQGRQLLPTVRGIDGNGVAAGGGGAVSGGRPRMSTYVDGVARSYSFAPDGTPSLWDVKQVEVLQGAQSTTLGRNSIAGAFVVETEDPKFKREFAVQSGVRSEGTTYGTAAMANLPLSDQIAVRLTHEASRGDGWVRYTAPSLAGYDTSSTKLDETRLKVLFAPSALPDWLFKLTLAHQDRSDAQVDLVAGPNFLKGENTDASSFSPRRTQNDVLSLQTVGELGSGWTFDALLAQQKSLNSVVSPDPSLPNFLNINARATENSFEPKFIYAAADSRTRAVLGAFLFDRDRNELGTPGSAFPYGATDDAKTLSLFGDARLQLSPKWDLLAGARLERERQQRNLTSDFGFAFDFNEDAKVFLPKLGAQYHVTPDLSFGAMGYRGYQAGGGGFSFTSFTPYTFRKEFSDTAELFMRSQWLERTLTLNANAFHSRFKDQQLSGFGPGGAGDSIYINAERSHTMGLELDMRYTPKASAWDLNAGLALLRTEIDRFGGNAANAVNDGKQFGVAPKFSARIGANWRFAPRFSLQGDVQYVGRYFSTYNNLATDVAGDYTVVNLALSYTSGPWTLRAFVNNLADARYVLYKDSVFTNGSIGTPRTVGASARLTF